VTLLARLLWRHLLDHKPMGYQTVRAPCGNGRWPEDPHQRGPWKRLEGHRPASNYRNWQQNPSRDRHPEVRPRPLEPGEPRRMAGTNLSARFTSLSDGCIRLHSALRRPLVLCRNRNRRRLGSTLHSTIPASTADIRPRAGRWS